MFHVEPVQTTISTGIFAGISGYPAQKQIKYPHMTVKALEKLTDIKVRTAKPTDKNYKLSDGGGLYLLVKADGGKYWRYDYRFIDRARTMALGVYPETTMRAARDKHKQARQLLAEGIDPMAQRKTEKLTARTDMQAGFEAVAREMWEKKLIAGRSRGYVDSILAKLEKDVFPWIGARTPRDLEHDEPALLAILHRVERRAPETARRLRGIIGDVFRYAISTSRARRDPTQTLKGAVITPKAGHFAAITTPEKFRDLLRGLHSYTGEMVTQCLLQLSPLVFQRPSELRNAGWDEFDLTGKNWGAPMWEIPAERAGSDGDTKVTRTGWESHLVPLSRQAVDILTALQPLTGRTGMVFASQRKPGQPLSNNTVRGALMRLGFAGEMTAHGFRASARTLAAERLGTPVEVLELQITHKVADSLGRAYNRTAFLQERVHFMQQWADYMDTLRFGGQVFPLVRAA
ncbi:tyrosine-type recombinase/integrase [Bordetella avium]|uniref:tyrosine-type recombinase/integrase n=1 Tax=Bordetella avium TaxID=521 RepID=UPI0013E32E5C|nr:integrase arm-type DNA-binding domain-containing protein [Bordetella avium]